MKFTSEDLMKAMGLAVGDKIKVTFEFTDEQIFEITKSVQGTIYLQAITDFYTQADLGDLIDQEFEILPRPKRVGATNGDDYENCINCPLRLFSYCGDYCDGNLSLYEVLEQAIKYAKRKGLFDQEIYDLLNARLDKEVLKEYEN